MPTRVILTVNCGPLTGKSLTYEKAATVLIGREEDCDLVLPNDSEHKKISRRQCELLIDPPDVRLRDLDSLNGTSVNERVISRSVKPEPGEVPGQCNLGDGDRITLGATVLCVRIEVPAVCDRCQIDVPDDQLAAWRIGDGVFLCPRCRKPSDVPDTQPVIPGLTIQKQLGAGGMGAVYLAHEDGTGREVALKVMLPNVAVHPRARSLFLREMKAIRLLEHPNIVAFLEAGDANGVLYFTMEHCAGGSVRDLLRGGPLPPTEAVPLILAALDALDFAHNLHLPDRTETGVIHRDLSPDNLFLTAPVAGRVCKVGDFGLAKILDASGLSGFTRTGTTAGKADYMCRQQIQNYKYARPEVDVWALAACLYTLLTGSTPRDFPAGRDRFSIVQETAPVPIRQRRDDVPARLATLIDAALADHIDLAFRSAAAFRTALLSETT
jgi:hypothetical protein